MGLFNIDDNMPSVDDVNRLKRRIEELTLREDKLVELYCDAYIAANKLDYIKDRHVAKTRLMELMK